MTQRTEAAIIGAGPADFAAWPFVAGRGREIRHARTTVTRLRTRLEPRRLLERITVSLMERLGLEARLAAQRLSHEGFNFADGERLIRIDLAELTGQHVVYGQTELTGDLMDAAPERGAGTIQDKRGECDE